MKHRDGKFLEDEEWCRKVKMGSGNKIATPSKLPLYICTSCKRSNLLNVEKKKSVFNSG